jgi:hypothetical protein
MRDFTKSFRLFSFYLTGIGKLMFFRDDVTIPNSSYSNSSPRFNQQNIGFNMHSHQLMPIPGYPSRLTGTMVRASIESKFHQSN